MAPSVQGTPWRGFLVPVVIFLVPYASNQGRARGIVAPSQLSVSSFDASRVLTRAVCLVLFACMQQLRYCACLWWAHQPKPLRRRACAPEVRPSKFGPNCPSQIYPNRPDVIICATAKSCRSDVASGRVQTRALWARLVASGASRLLDQIIGAPFQFVGIRGSWKLPGRFPEAGPETLVFGIQWS